MAELMILTPGSTHDIPVIPDGVEVDIPPLLVYFAVGRNNLFVDHLTNHLSSRVITKRDPRRIEDK